MNAPFIKVQHLHLHLPPGPVDLGTLPRSRAANTSASLRFELSADGTYVTDHKLGLLWPVDESEKEMPHAEAQLYAAKTVIDGQACRLPEEFELQSLRDLTRHNPAIFPVFKCRAGWTWTNTPTPWSSGLVFCVYFSHGCVHGLDRDHEAFVRPVRSVSASQCRGAVELKELYVALRLAQRHKKPSENQLAFDSCWIDGLIELQGRLNAGTWSPAPTTCFIAQRPKARQIHAPDFGDRIVHHWLVPQLEAVYEPSFIHDSYASRRCKGTHAAVDRLERFVRQVYSGQASKGGSHEHHQFSHRGLQQPQEGSVGGRVEDGSRRQGLGSGRSIDTGNRDFPIRRIERSGGSGWYLQLDIANFFNSIHRPTLYRLLKDRLQRAGMREPALRAVHALLRHPVQRQGVIHRSTAAERARVPAHKRLENAAPGCGLPIGNLSSQFFANVYLNELDQFIKHTLKAGRYLRYVDDFVLVHRDHAQLERWQAVHEESPRTRIRIHERAVTLMREWGFSETPA